MTALVKLSNSSFWGLCLFMYFVFFVFFACFGFCCCFCLFDFSSSRITIYRSYNIFGRRSVDDRKAINFLIIEEKKMGRASKFNFPRGKADWGKFTDTLKDMIEYQKS